MPKIIDLSPGWPGGPEDHLRVVDISDDAEAVSKERARFVNGTLADWRAGRPFWYDRDPLVAAGLVPA